MRMITRSAWGAARPRQVTTRAPSLLKGVVIHWFGVPDSRKDHADCDAQVRAVQRSHQAGEFVDIAYNHLVCRHGYVYEGRGFGVQTGANGTGETNEDYAAVCVMVGAKDLAGAYTPALNAALTDIVNAWLSKTGGDEVRTHGSITGSQCPGPTLEAWVEDEGWLVESEEWRKKRLATLRVWILAYVGEHGWAAVKDTHNWAEFKRLGGT